MKELPNLRHLTNVSLVLTGLLEVGMSSERDPVLT